MTILERVGVLPLIGRNSA